METVFLPTVSTTVHLVVVNYRPLKPLLQQRFGLRLGQKPREDQIRL